MEPIIVDDHSQDEAHTTNGNSFNNCYWEKQQQQQQQHHQHHHQNTTVPRPPSNVSLASAYSEAESFTTCYEPPSLWEEGEHDPYFFSTHNSTSHNNTIHNNNMTSLASVSSFGCLNNVMEEDDYSNGSIANNDNNNNHGHLPVRHIVPLQSFAQLQQQPPPPQLTAARLALSSDIGVLRRSLAGVHQALDEDDDEDIGMMMNYDHGTYQQQHQHQKPMMTATRPHQKLAHVLMERDQRMTLSALPMSRCFATPRMAIGTAFRSSFADNNKKKRMMPPALVMEQHDDDDDVVSMDVDYDMIRSTTKPSSIMTALSRQQPLACLETLADDVQLHIISFLPLHDVRAVMSTNGRFRRLMMTENAQNLWHDWCSQYQWAQMDNNSTTTSKKELLLVDDLSLPMAARPSTRHAMTDRTPMSSWHTQANLSLLLSMAQSQPTEIDKEQLCEYTTWSRRRRHSRRARRLSTMGESSQPLLRYWQSSSYHDSWVVQFMGRVGQGDRCVRSDQALPRPTLITGSKSSWTLPTSLSCHNSNSGNSSFGHGNSSFAGGTMGAAAAAAFGGSDHHGHHGASLLDLFCRSARAAIAPQPAWRPFVAPFLSHSGSAHLTPRLVSYFEVSILEPQTEEEPEHNNTTNGDNNNTGAPPARASRNDCVAVGVATEAFDWHARMPGWDAHSFGYHGDDGGIFHSSGGMLRKFGPSYGRGDVVGCGIDHVARGIFFTLNGNFVGYAWQGLPMDMLQKDMYPVVGIDTNDWIRCNFGTEPFKYDLKSMIVRHEDLVHQSLAASACHS